MCYSLFAIREYQMAPASLRPQDVLVLSKLLAYRGHRPPMAQMGIELSISSSEVHAALRRLKLSRLVLDEAGGTRLLLEPIEEFLVHGVKYAFPAKRGEITRGMLTSYAAPPLSRQISAGSDLPPVWPFSEGKNRGVAVEPFYKTVPLAALRDPILYELLALIDALREGRTRERKIAERELIARLRRQLDERGEPAAARGRG